MMEDEATDPSGRANSRAALLSAALEEFTDKGYEAATVADIAERAGVTTGALYAHFRGKLDLLFQAVGLRSFDNLVRDAEAGEADRTSDEVVARFGRDLARPISMQSLLLLDVIVLARRDANLAARFGRLHAAKISSLAAATDQGRASGVITPDLSSEDLSRLVVLLAFGKMAFAALDAELPSEAAFFEFASAILRSGAPARRPQSELASVAVESANAIRARVKFEASVVSATNAGHSLRQIGEAAGISHEQVRRIVADAREKKEKAS
jgi:AcrR family transcriptional regulator